MASEIRLVSGLPDAINFNRPSGQTADVDAGTVILVGGKPYVTIASITMNPVNKYNNGLAYQGGTYRGKCATSAAANAAIYWDFTNKKFTTSAGGNTFFGYVAPTSGTATADTDIEVFHCPLCTPCSGAVVTATAAPVPTADTVTDNSGGTAGTTIAVIGAEYVQADVANAIASLAAQIAKLKADNAALITALTTAGVLE